MGSSKAHLAELQRKVGDDGSSGRGGEGHDDQDADGASGDEGRWPAAVRGGRRVKTRRRAAEEIMVAEAASAMVETAPKIVVVALTIKPPKDS